MSTSLEENARRILDELDQKGLKRHLRTVGKSQNGHTLVHGRDMINFSSNNYMGLAQNPLLIERAQEWADQWGVGSTASRLVCGTMELHERVEDRLITGKGGEAALIFNSGFQANSAILSTLFDKDLCDGEPLVFCDRLNHASMHHGLKASGVRQIRYHHNDLNHLEDCLKRHQNKQTARFILTESVFSMDGDQSPVDDLIHIAERYGVSLYIDEAHATGVFGKNGFGLCAHKDVTFKMGTFSKALGGFGSYLVCPKIIRDYLISKCNGFIYSTSLPPSVLGAMDAALELVPQLDDTRKKLLNNAERVRNSIRKAGFEVGTSSTQIIPIIIGDEKRTLAVSAKLEEAGILGVAIRPPTVPAHSSRIRLALSAAHSDQDISYLCDVIDGFQHG